MEKFLKILFVVAAVIVLHEIINSVFEFIGWISSNQVTQAVFFESGLLWKLAAVVIIILLYMLLVNIIRRRQEND